VNPLSYPLPLRPRQ